MPALRHATAAARSFVESPFGQIIPIYGATHPQPFGAPPPPPTADGGAPTPTQPLGGGAGNGAARPATSDIASANE
ncbi:Uncharacterised protein [Mycobacterium tuberculosis]|nr:Uncharacterised protein [Mycobacterium tuberculosis]